jgi:hypothetical protein
MTLHLADWIYPYPWLQADDMVPAQIVLTEDIPMAAVPITLQGVIYFSDVGVGGGPMPGGPGASHPIAPGGQPPGIWPPLPGQGLPGQPPGIWPSPGHPSHPIAPGGQPPGVWPPPGRPDQGLPGQPGHPDQGLPGGAPPGYILVWVPGHGWSYIHVGTGPDQGLPGQQPGGGQPGQPPGPSQGPGFPTQPIAPGGQPGHQPSPPPSAQPKK